MEETKPQSSTQKFIQACEDVIDLMTENLQAIVCGESPKHAIDNDTKKLVLSVIEKRSNYEHFDKVAAKVKGDSEPVDTEEEEQKSVSVTATFSGNFFEAVSEKVKEKANAKG